MKLTDKAYNLIQWLYKTILPILANIAGIFALLNEAGYLGFIPSGIMTILIPIFAWVAKVSKQNWILDNEKLAQIEATESAIDNAIKSDDLPYQPKSEDEVNNV